VLLEKGSMSITIKLLDSDAKISADINKALAKEINKSLQKSQRKVISEIKALIPGWIRQQPEIASLREDGVRGSLNAQFGLLSNTSDDVVDQIITSVASSVEVTIKPITTITKSPVVVFSIQPITFENLLGIPLGKVTTLKGTVLNWLEWLLLLGNSTIIYGYSYQPDGTGRSGGGTMQGGSVFRVPPQFVGTANNNFVNRAVSKRDRELKIVFERIFK
jgi:hypothetical protein